MGENGDIVGMVDVLKLTYATLDQVNQPVKLATKFPTKNV